MNNRWFYLAVIALLIAAWMMRWDVYAQHNGDARGSLYLIDRFTGQLWSLDWNEMYLVKPAKP